MNYCEGCHSCIEPCGREEINPPFELNNASVERQIAYLEFLETKLAERANANFEGWAADAPALPIVPPKPTADRFNAGKPDLSLIPVDAQMSEAQVWGKGAVKYGRNNWTKLWGDDTINVALASLLRHAAALQQGEFRDSETGELHAGHIRCNAAMIIRYCLEQEAANNA